MNKTLKLFDWLVLNMTLAAGTKAPDFEGSADDGRTLKLSELLKEGPVVLYFYPKDETPGCTKEACTFRDNWDEIRKLGATVLGVSSDSAESHRKFKENRKLQFPLLSDEDGSIRKMYEAKGRLLPDRVTYIINTDGNITHVYKSQLNASQHAAEAITALNSIKQ